ncbi:MAG: hypothetical protein MZV70_60590 [Desulfobacterales bacterium]|nr:hypothetical protein [Desulfobacterales bacterium]
MARLNVPAARAGWPLREGYGGVAGHYALVGRSVIRAAACRGAARSGRAMSARPMLVSVRELNRQVDWIFSNHAGRGPGAGSAVFSVRRLTLRPPVRRRPFTTP